MSTELLAPLDLAFWHLESDAHPMHLGALAVFDPAPGVSAPQLLDLLGARAAAIPRLRMRVRDVLLPVGGAAWFTDKDFEVQRHVTRVVLPEGDFLTEAGRLAGELMEQPLGRGLPPWRMYLLDSPGDGPFAVLVKLHHALADGMRAVAIGAGIFDQIASAGAGRGAVNRRTPVPPRSWLPGPYEVAGMARERLGEVGRALGVGASVVRASRLDLRATTALAARSSGTRRLATAELDAATVQRIRRTEGGTANDVLLAVGDGAAHRRRR
ncbi:wax ester/triacylglycerol synthase domain-containing protein, partial [Streptomyces sp. NPDC024062]|uniref:wax ester/triacylglycerol synthase domain-containing protein n=1 Tax=Streptomyces sp. NPDC024062 TaxID=3156646 RepID=UPI0034518A28